MSTVIPTSGPSAETFGGFQSLEANFILCPNQYLDLCLRHCNRGEVRAVTYILAETLRWRDKNGQPINQDIVVKHADLVTKANIGYRSVKDALVGAVQKNFLECKQHAKPKRRGYGAEPGIYSLRWDYSVEYATTLHAFDGFWAGEGRRSPIPLDFFTVVVPSSTLGEIKVCGDVLRHTLGYESQFGRRQQAARSFDQIQRYTGIKDRGTVAAAIRSCVKKKYITRVEEGVFDKDVDVQRPATYGPKWLHQDEMLDKSAKIPPADVGKNSTSVNQRKSHQNSGENPTSLAAKNQPGKPGENPTTRKKAQKQTNKQQVVVEILVQQGFSKRVAQQISTDTTLEVAERQIAWLPHREPVTNPIGLLRRAIEEDWDEPSGLQAERLAEQKISIDQKRQQSQKNREATNAAVLHAMGEWNSATEDLQSSAYNHAIKHYPKQQVAIDKSTRVQPHPLVLDSLLHLLESRTVSTN